MTVDVLTPDQRQIVELPVTQRALVVAGPGTGKTHTLRHRIVHLTETEQVIASTELVVLSFTNAVVRELRDRLADHPRASAMRPTTIDSLARRIAGATEGISHDRAMKLATDRIAAQGDTEFADLRHLIVDEVQDLGSLRRAFVETLLATTDAGCTLLGDPAQGIYGFDEPEASDPVVSLAHLPRIKTYSLSADHRTLNDRVRLAASLRASVIKRSPDAYAQLSRHLRDIQPIPDLDRLALILRRSSATTGLLSRTNGEILWISDELRGLNVLHQIKRRADGVVLEPWPAVVLGGVTAKSLTRKTFRGLVEEHLPDLDVTGAWRAIRRLATSADGRDVDMSRLRARLLHRPVDLHAADRPDQPILSTIHRSKGLQYDRVILHEHRERGDADLAAESRVLYVAMTRARRTLVPLARQQCRDGRLQLARGRWTLRAWDGRSIAVEARVGDVLDSEPPGGEAAAQTQRYIHGIVAVGDEVCLQRQLAGSRAYEVLHGETVVGIVSTGLQEAIETFLPSLPTRITGARVDAVTTGVGDPAIGGQLGLPASGLWLRIEISGLLKGG